eukprot:jgi/Mesvir1/12577/Mv10327-RA.1
MSSALKTLTVISAGRASRVAIPATWKGSVANATLCPKSLRSSAWGSPCAASMRRLHATPCASASTTVNASSQDSAGASADGTASNARKGSVAQAPKDTGKASLDLNPPRGTRDFYPEDMRLRNWLFGHFREVSRLFGFDEFDAPVLESEELYTRKAGEEITQQLYNFEDKGGRAMSLRPEITPSLARMVLQKGKGQPMPVKWFVIGQCWRYERMTRGRRREHYQWNMDIVGVPDISAEAELLAAITTFFQRVGLTSADVGIKVNNRKVLHAVLDRYGIPEESFAPVCVIVDKIEKLPREKVEEELAAVGVGKDAVDGILQSMQIQSLDALEALLGAESPALAELRQLFVLAEAYGYADWLKFDASVVRGLAYYTGTVFEAFDRSAQLRAICGGGRYDKLLSTYGGADTPACGFGFGDAVIVELLKEKKALPELPPAVDDLVLPLTDDMRVHATSVAQRLRRSGRSVDLVLDSKRVKWANKQAERVGARRLVMVGSQDWAEGRICVKDQASGEEQRVAVADI